MTALSDKDLRKALISGSLVLDPYSDTDLQPASVDLRLNAGPYYLTETYFNEVREERLKKFASWRGYLESRPIFEVGKTYLVRGPFVKMPLDCFGTVEQKSTAGRLGIYSEVLLEGHSTLIRANHIPAGFEGRIWFRIEVRAFPIIFAPGDKINQLRIRKVGSDFMTIMELKQSYGKELGMRDQSWKLLPFEKTTDGNSTIIHLDISRALIQKSPVVEPIEYGKQESYEIADYWYVGRSFGNELTVPKGILYLLASKEATETGSAICWKMAIKTEELGLHAETHRAGFGDPGFKATVTSEFINHHKNMLVVDGQFLSRLLWERTTSIAERAYSGNYQKQISPQPPKQFRYFNKVWERVESGDIETKRPEQIRKEMKEIGAKA